LACYRIADPIAESLAARSVTRDCIAQLITECLLGNLCHRLDLHRRRLRQARSVRLIGRRDTLTKLLPLCFRLLPLPFRFRIGRVSGHYGAAGEGPAEQHYANCPHNLHGGRRMPR